MLSIAKLNFKARDDLFELFFESHANKFQTSSSEFTRGIFYDIMVYLFDSVPLFKPHAKQSLVAGLSDSNKLVREKLIDFWNDHNRLDLDPLN